MSVLDKIFIGYINDEVYRGNDESVSTLKAYEDCKGAMKDVPQGLQNDIYDAICHYGYKREELGFVNGFRHAVQIMTECITKGGVDA